MTSRSLPSQVADWLETHWVAPAYGGWVLLGLTIFFFGAATNTMAGWLYVMSGVGVALLGLAAVLPVRSLRGIRVKRRPSESVSAGDVLTIALDLKNQTAQPKLLLQAQDLLPASLGEPARVTIPAIPPQSSYSWVHYQRTERRGVYHWHTVELRTGAPFGLFWCRRRQTVKATAIVYPQVLSLGRCPLIDEIGRETSLRAYGDRRSHSAMEGETRSLRPYRWGDPLRLVHWRSSARYGELRVRELELFTGGQEVIIALDSATTWLSEHFEQAVVAATSLYCYSRQRHFKTQFWSAGTGLIQGDRVVLTALASVEAGEEAQATAYPNRPLIWLTQNSHSCETLPTASRWVLWSRADRLGRSPTPQASSDYLGLVIQPDRPLETQLQSPLTFVSHA